MIAERPARVEGFAVAVSVDDPDNTSLRTPAAGVHLSAARAAFGSFGQRVHCSPFHGFENPARRPLRDDGARAPRPELRLLRMVAFKPGGAAGARATDPCGGGSASGSASVHFFRPGTATYWPLPAWRCCRRLFASVFGERPVGLSRNHGHSVSLLSNYRSWRSELCASLVK